MNTIITFGIIISLVLGIAGFVASNNIIVGGVILALSIIYFLVIAKPMFSKYRIKINRFHLCYHFINSFIVSLSIRNSINSAFDSSYELMPEDFHKEIENIEALKLEEKFDVINKYFRFHAFSLFLNLINIYEENGGNILEMSRHLLEELRMTEEYISSCESINKKKIMEFVILWILTLGIMVFMRFALSEFFNKMSSQLFYPIGIFVILLFCLITIHMAISKMTKLKIKGWNDHEKIK